MKRMLLAASAIIALGAAMPRPAHALFGVADTCADCAKEWTQIASWAKQAKDMAFQADQWRQANLSLNGIVGSVSGAAGVNLSGLNDVRSVLSDVGEVRGVVSGFVTSGQAGLSGFSVSGAANTILNQNTVYRPQSGDFMAQWLNARAQGQASQQAYMQEFITSAQARQQALLELKQRQMTASTTDERMAIQNEIGRTQEELSTQEQQARAIAALGDMQERVSQQQMMEKQRADADGLVRMTKSYADSMGVNPSWTGDGGSTLAAAARPAVVDTVPSVTAPINVPTFNVSANQ